MPSRNAHSLIVISSKSKHSIAVIEEHHTRGDEVDPARLQARRTASVPSAVDAEDRVVHHFELAAFESELVE